MMTKMITAHSSVVKVPQGIYRLCDILARMNVKSHPMKVKEIDNKTHYEKMADDWIQSMIVSDPDERCELWNRSP